MGSRRETRARDEQAASLRGVGYSWQAIADQLGYQSRQAAQVAVARHYDRLRDTPTLARRSLIEGIRLVQTVLIETMADAKNRGDVQAITSTSREFRLNTRELARIDGLNAPQQYEVKVTHHQTMSEIIAETRERLRTAIDAEVVDVKEIE